MINILEIELDLSYVNYCNCRNLLSMVPVATPPHIGSGYLSTEY